MRTVETIAKTRLAAWLALGLVLGLTACDDKQAANNTPTKPDATKMEPQTDQSAPATQRPKQ